MSDKANSATLVQHEGCINFFFKLDPSILLTFESSKLNCFSRCEFLNSLIQNCSFVSLINLDVIFFLLVKGTIFADCNVLS